MIYEVKAYGTTIEWTASIDTAREAYSKCSASKFNKRLYQFDPKAGTKIEVV
jgi:hypothetical protein